MFHFLDMLRDMQWEFSTIYNILHVGWKVIFILFDQSSFLMFAALRTIYVFPANNHALICVFVCHIKSQQDTLTFKEVSLEKFQ